MLLIVAESRIDVKSAKYLTMLNFLSFLSEAKAFHGSKEGIRGPITTTRGPFFMAPSSPYQGTKDMGERIAAAYATGDDVSVESGDFRGSSDAMVYEIEVEKPRDKKGMNPRQKRKARRSFRREAGEVLAASPSGLSPTARERQGARVTPKLSGGIQGGPFTGSGREEIVVPKHARGKLRVKRERYADEPEGKFRPSNVRGMSRFWRPFMGVSAVRGVPLSGERRMAAIAPPDTNPNDNVPVYGKQGGIESTIARTVADFIRQRSRG